jgi:septum formation protein
MQSFFKEIERFDIILGSASPRRHQLLTALGVRHRIVLRPIDESVPEGLRREAIALYLAKKKSEGYRDLLLTSRSLVLTADTIVCVGDTLVGKPADRADAIRMLTFLSGKEHEVFTGVCIASPDREAAFTTGSTVRFKALQPGEIEYYVDTYEPYDKAGSYGVQDWFGLTAIEHIGGSYHNVMGLPVKEVYEHLQSFF